MKHTAISWSFILLLLGGGFLARPGPILAGEHFLAIDVPEGSVRAQIQHRQDKIKGLLKPFLQDINDKHQKGKHKKKAIVHRHTSDNLHVSLMRFGHIPDNKLSAYQKAIKQAVSKAHLHPFDLADKIDHASLHVWPKKGFAFIVYRLKPSNRLKKFMDAVTAELAKQQKATKKTLPHGASDAPDYLHISIARVDGLSDAELKKLKKLLEENVDPLKRSPFPVHKIHLKVSHEKPLTYTNVGHAFDLPKATTSKTKKLKTKKFQTKK